MFKYDEPGRNEMNCLHSNVMTTASQCQQLSVMTQNDNPYSRDSQRQISRTGGGWSEAKGIHTTPGRISLYKPGQGKNLHLIHLFSFFFFFFFFFFLFFYLCFFLLLPSG